MVIESEEIKFEGVPIVTPNGDILVKSLTFYVKPGVSGMALVAIKTLNIKHLSSLFTATSPHRRT